MEVMTHEEAIRRIYQKKTDEKWIQLYNDVLAMNPAERNKIGREYELLGMTYNTIMISQRK